MPVIDKEKINEVNTSLASMTESLELMQESLSSNEDLLKKVEQGFSNLKNISAELLGTEFEDNFKGLKQIVEQNKLVIEEMVIQVEDVVNSIEEAE